MALCYVFQRRSGKYSYLDTESEETKESDENKETTMAKLRDSLSKLREHLDNLQKKKGFPYDSDNENDMIMSNGNDSQQVTSADESDKTESLRMTTYPVHISKINKLVGDDNNNDDDNRSNGEGDDTGGDTSMNESDTASTGTSQRGTNDRYKVLIIIFYKQ